MGLFRLRDLQMGFNFDKMTRRKHIRKDFFQTRTVSLSILTILLLLWRTNAHSQPEEIPALQDSVVKMRVKLIKVELTPPCGIFAWTSAQKFEIVQAKLPDYPGKKIILLHKCPEFLGINFFEQGKLYDVVIFKDPNSGVGALNAHREEKLPTYWCGRIDKVK